MRVLREYSFPPRYRAFGLNSDCRPAAASIRPGLSTSWDERQYHSTVNIGEVVAKTSTTANRWQLPALVEAGLFRHFRFGVGPVVSLLSGVERTKVVDPPSAASIYAATYGFPVSREAAAGAAAALEFPFRLGNTTLAPELRYKRWFDANYRANWLMDELTAGVAIRFSRSR
jgi:hypothetical protein